MPEFAQVDYAKYFSIGCHGLQKRKYTHEPYWTHPQKVVEILSQYYPSIEAYIVGWLHDVVEDTWATCFDIEEHFGIDIAKYVSQLTMPSKEFGNREKRITSYNFQLAQSCELVQTVKYADLLHNTESITKYDHNFAKIYLAEKRKLLPMINKGEQRLYERVCEQCGL